MICDTKLLLEPKDTYKPSVPILQKGSTTNLKGSLIWAKVWNSAEKAAAALVLSENNLFPLAPVAYSAITPNTMSYQVLRLCHKH